MDTPWWNQTVSFSLLSSSVWNVRVLYDVLTSYVFQHEDGSVLQWENETQLFNEIKAMCDRNYALAYLNADQLKEAVLKYAPQGFGHALWLTFFKDLGYDHV